MSRGLGDVYKRQIQVRDLGDYVPNLHPFLDLPPGFRFQTDTRGKQKVWFDGSLLDV